MGVVRLFRLAVGAAVVYELLLMIAVNRPDLAVPTTIGSDTSNYFAAGQRLNAGHPLYSLTPGDRNVPIDPPFFFVPLLSPPPIAVVWRPLALVGDAGMWAWWIGTIAVSLVVVGWLLSGANLAQLAGVALLGQAIALTTWSGNVNGIVAALIAGSWVASVRGRSSLAGSAIAMAAALKLGPLLLGWWLIVRRDWVAVRAFAVTLAVVGAITVVGAGAANDLAYLKVMRDTTVIGPTGLSIAGLLDSIGVPAQIAASATLLFIGFAMASIWLLRRHAGASFAISVVSTVFATPVVLFGNFAIFVAALVPWGPAGAGSESRLPVLSARSEPE
jgi:hypothetical protein